MSSKYINDDDISRISEALDRELADILAQAAEATSNIRPAATDLKSGQEEYYYEQEEHGSEPVFSETAVEDDWDKALPAEEVWNDNEEKLELEEYPAPLDHLPLPSIKEQEAGAYRKSNKRNEPSRHFSDDFWRNLEEATKISSSILSVPEVDGLEQPAKTVADLSPEALERLIERAVENGVYAALTRHAKSKV